MDIILGSSSPRRKEILEYFSLPFRQVSPHFDEDSVQFTGDPVLYVETLAKAKGHTLLQSNTSSLIITDDTTVFKSGKNFGKPQNEPEAIAMLQELSGDWHSVYTAISVTTQKRQDVLTEETKVECNMLTQDQIMKAIEKHSLYNKAGAYAIQKSGGLIVKRIDGCYYNVVGFPINSLRKLLLVHGIELWDYVKELE